MFGNAEKDTFSWQTAQHKNIWSIFVELELYTQYLKVASSKKAIARSEELQD